MARNEDAIFKIDIDTLIEYQANFEKRLIDRLSNDLKQSNMSINVIKPKPLIIPDSFCSMRQDRQWKIYDDKGYTFYAHATSMINELALRLVYKMKNNSHGIKEFDLIFNISAQFSHEWNNHQYYSMHLIIFYPRFLGSESIY